MKNNELTCVKINTSSSGKLAEYRNLFGSRGIEVLATTSDLPEIESDKLSVVVHKASSVPEGTLVDDTSLEVEGVEIGVNIRWYLGRLHQFIGRKALWTCLIAQRQGERVRVYGGELAGRLVEPRRDEKLGFRSYFLPEGATLTVAEDWPDHLNPRALAVEAFLSGRFLHEAPLLTEWQGAWQVGQIHQ